MLEKTGEGSPDLESMFPEFGKKWSVYGGAKRGRTEGGL